MIGEVGAAGRGAAVRPHHCRLEAAGRAAAPGQSAAAHQRAVAVPRRLPPLPPLPFQSGPVEFVEAGRVVAVRCPRKLAHILQRAGAIREPDTGRWLVRPQPNRPGSPGARGGDRSAVPPSWRVAGLSEMGPD
jgi:hypothetical protein